MRAGAAGIIALLAAALMPCAADAQSGAQVYSSFLLTQRAPDLTASAVSSSVAFGLPSGVTVPVAVVCNLGPVNVYVALGGVTVTADPGLSMLVMPGACARLNATGSTNLAAITQASATDTPTVQIMLGSGNP